MDFACFPEKTHFLLILGGFKTFYFSIVKSWRGAGKIFGLWQGSPGFFLASGRGFDFDLMVRLVSVYQLIQVITDLKLG